MNTTEQTSAEVAHFEFAERYIRELLETASSLTDHERTLIAGNIRGFYAHAFPFTPTTDSVSALLKEAETAIEEYSCRTPVPHVATEMSGLAQRLRSAALRATKPFSTYPEDRDGLIALCKKVEEFSIEVNAVKLADWVRAILEDEQFA